MYVHTRVRACFTHLMSKTYTHTCTHAHMNARTHTHTHTQTKLIHNNLTMMFFRICLVEVVHHIHYMYTKWRIHNWLFCVINDRWFCSLWGYIYITSQPHSIVPHILYTYWSEYHLQRHRHIQAKNVVVQCLNDEEQGNHCKVVAGKQKQIIMLSHYNLITVIFVCN